MNILYICTFEKRKYLSFLVQDEEAIGRSNSCCFSPFGNTSGVKGIKIHQFVQADLAVLGFSWIQMCRINPAKFT